MICQRAVGVIFTLAIAGAFCFASPLSGMTSMESY